ncbi:MAG: hypothetical protein ACC645_06760 [Pirellulales bacterium]
MLRMTISDADLPDGTTTTRQAAPPPNRSHRHGRTRAYVLSVMQSMTYAQVDVRRQGANRGELVKSVRS